MDRRGFLKRVGATTLAVVAAPLFIPSCRLDFGVPKQALAASESVEMLKIIGGEVGWFGLGYATFGEVHATRGRGETVPFTFDTQALLDSVFAHRDDHTFDFTPGDWRVINADVLTGSHWQPVTKDWLAGARKD